MGPTGHRPIRMPVGEGSERPKSRSSHREGLAPGPPWPGCAEARGVRPEFGVASP